VTHDKHEDWFSGLVFSNSYEASSGCNGMHDTAQHSTVARTCVLGGLALGVVEVGGHGDHGLLDILWWWTDGWLVGW
jgi:hypothetical protein